MPTYLLRVDRDTPTYVAWSTVVEAPTFMGDRTAALRWLRSQLGCSEPCCYTKYVTERLERADAYGTSSIDGFYGYGDAGMIVEQRGWLPRSALGLFARAYSDGDEDDWLPYLQPFEDDVLTAVADGLVRDDQ